MLDSIDLRGHYFWFFQACFFYVIFFRLAWAYIIFVRTEPIEIGCL